MFYTLVKSALRRDGASILFLAGLTAGVGFIFAYAFFANAITIIEIVGYVSGFTIIMLLVGIVVMQTRKDELRYFGVK